MTVLSRCNSTLASSDVDGDRHAALGDPVVKLEIETRIAKKLMAADENGSHAGFNGGP